MKIGITGSEGFIGGHLARACEGRGWAVSACPRESFARPEELAAWVGSCDRVVHLAGLSRHPDGELLYRTNMALAEALDTALQAVPRPLYFASTTHDLTHDLPYHRSKRDARALFERSGRYPVITLRMANAFGPGSRPFYNSVVSTFCKIAADGGTPERVDDVPLELIDVGELVAAIDDLLADPAPVTGAVEIGARHFIRLPELWEKLARWRKTPPEDPAGFDELLWKTFRSCCR